MNPVLKYHGGKSREMSRFLPYIPHDFHRYIEPFFGGGAVYFYLEPKEAIINDINKRLMLFYCQLRDSYDEMRLQLDKLQQVYEANQLMYKILKASNPDAHVPNENEALYYRMREIFNYPGSSYLDSVVYYFINKTAYAGMMRYNQNGEFNVPFGRYSHFNTGSVTMQHSRLLRNAELYSLDYRQIFDMVRNDDFIFLDPPYDCVFHDYGNMENGFDETDHRRLAGDFKHLSCRALMIIGKTPLTTELYDGFVVDEYVKNYAVNIKNRFCCDKVHMIVTNY